MAIKYSIEKHAVAFPSKLLAQNGGKHIYNIELATDTDNGNLVVKKDGSFDYDDVKINSGLNLFTFEGAVYRAESDGSAKVVLDNPFATDIPSVDVETDNYYYDITGSAVVVYDKSLNLVLYKDIPYSFSIDANVLRDRKSVV